MTQPGDEGGGVPMAVRHGGTQRPPRGASSRALFVDTPVSSRKTSFVISSVGWDFCHSRRAACTSARSCSLACRVFFKREFPFIELMP